MSVLSLRMVFPLFLFRSNVIFSLEFHSLLSSSHESGWFRMRIPDVYYDLFTNAEIANHIHCFCAAKKLAQAMGDEERLYVDQTTNNGLSKVYMCPATYSDTVAV
jgi:hypothetical protein